MIYRSFSTLYGILLISVALSGCEKDAGFGDEIAPSSSARAAFNCDALAYSDTLFYYNEQSKNNIEKPLQQRAGTYGAFPAGLAINANTGAIDVNKSESGLKYRVWFKARGAADSCIRYVVISGINYRSQVYNLAAGQTVATPFYNAAGNKTGPNEGNDFNDDNDVAAVSLMKGKKRVPVEVEMDKKTGAINLAKTLRNGLFGAMPTNGSSEEFRLYYRLNDASKRSLNYIDIRLHYYDRVALVPNSLLDQVNYKTTANFRIATPTTGSTAALGMANSEGSEVDGDERGPRPTRPPEIIIVGR